MSDKAEKAVKTEKPVKAAKKEKKPFFLIRFFRWVKKFFRDTVTEMKKVVWPSKKQILNNTGVVLIALAISAIFIGGLDSILGLIVRFALGGN